MQSLSALGVLAWKAGALYAENDGEWRIDSEIFKNAYGWEPNTVPSSGEYYYDGFDSLPPEEQERAEFRALIGAKVGNFMNLRPQVVEEAGFDPDEVSFENIGDFLTALNDDLKWPLTRIAEWFKQSGL